MRWTQGLAMLLGVGLLAAGCQPSQQPPLTEVGSEGAVTVTGAPGTASEEPATAAPTIAVTDEPPSGPLFVLASEEPIIEAGQGGEWAAPLHNTGAVLYHDGVFHMFRNGYPSLPGNAQIGYATSPDGMNWAFDESSPVFGTQDVAYAGQMIMASSAQVEADGTWVLYFLIWESAETPGAIGRATAPAPAGPWTPDPAPVLQPGPEGSWDADSVTHPSVLPDETGSGYLMYYTGLDADEVERIGLATSPDGVTWTKVDHPVLEPGGSGEWDAEGAARGRVVRTPDGYVMIYRSSSRLGGYDYGLAMSPDGLHWAKANGNPFLQSADLPRNAPLYFPTLDYHDGTYYFYIEAYYDSTSHVYLLTRSEPLNMARLTGRQDTLSAGNFSVADVANRGDASDLEIRFEAALEANRIDAYQIVLVPTGEVAGFDAAAAAALPDRRLASIPADGKRSFHLRLPSGLLDVNGNPIEEGTAYVAYALSTGDGVQALSLASAGVTMANTMTVHTLIEEFPSATGGLAVDEDGNLYAANIGRAPARNGSEVYRITPQGEVSVWVEGQGIRGASGNTFDADGNLIQSSFKANTILRITPDGEVETYAEENVQGPVGVALAPDETLFVANCGGDNILRITPKGESEVLAEGLIFSCPNGITLDEDGNMYVVNFIGSRVVKVTPDGQAKEFAMLPGGNGGHILYHEGMLYVTSRGSHQVFTLSLDGVLTLLAGTGERGHADGPADQATFSLPNDLVFSPDGQRIYVNEVVPTGGTINLPSRIRVIELPRPG